MEQNKVPNDRKLVNISLILKKSLGTDVKFLDQIISDNQHGFRSIHSWLTNMMNFVHIY